MDNRNENQVNEEILDKLIKIENSLTQAEEKAKEKKLVKEQKNG